MTKQPGCLKWIYSCNLLSRKPTIVQCVAGDILKVHSMVFPDAPIKSVIVRRIAEAGVIGVEFMLI
ncbi:MAG: hypothetical protein QX198_02965 [Methylococcaceae bacterium]